MGEIEQQAFQTLKQCLITSPILRQVDPKKPLSSSDRMQLRPRCSYKEKALEYSSSLSSEKITRQQSEID
ncbi:hypothetical protein TNCV_4084201 [Trichonephila clavipes]|nr:hypothetical protein TNCV_4084201 [Trichonephila clavipes]